jgi:hypothetical protein
MATPATDTELKEVLNAVNVLSQKMEVGFANVDTKLSDLRGEMNQRFAQVDTKLSDLRGEMNVKFAQVDTKLAKIEGDITLLRQPKDFADFVKKGMAVTVFGGMLLTFGKFIIFGKV